MDKQERYLKRNTFDLSKEIAKQVTSPTIKDVKIMITGQPGSGMSYAAIKYSQDVAKRISYNLYGTPDNWEKFFDEKTGIIDKEEMKKLEKSKRK